MMNFADFAAKVSEDARLSDLIDRYDMDPTAMTDDEVSEIVARSYMGCYSDDC